VYPKATGLPAKKLGLKNALVIENGINLKRFNPDGNRKDLRKEFGFTEDDFVIGFVSRITLQKAPLDFVKSIAIAHQKDAKIKALLVGEGDMEEETKEAIRQNGIEEYIRTSPFRNDVPDVLHAINVFCLPSLWEGLSIALLEAMAMKKALVVTPTDGTREVITHQESGLIADFGQPEELAECYLTYLHYPEWIESYGNAAMAVIQERFDSRRVSQQSQKSIMTFFSDQFHSFFTSKHGHALIHSSGSISPFPFRSGSNPMSAHPAAG
jgi:glycosyltransferase involved in cell wall biosynthesis